MVEYVDIVICRHPNVHKEFTFRAPEGTTRKLDVGDWVLVNTCKGKNQIAQCVTPQFTIADFHLKELYGLMVDQLQPVTAYMKPICFMYTPAKEEKHAENRQQDNGEQV